MIENLTIIEIPTINFAHGLCFLHHCAVSGKGSVIKQPRPQCLSEITLITRPARLAPVTLGLSGCSAIPGPAHLPLLLPAAATTNCRLTYHSGEGQKNSHCSSPVMIIYHLSPLPHCPDCMKYFPMAQPSRAIWLAHTAHCSSRVENVWDL